MIDFGFISDDAFRASLESDWQEIESCLKAKCWKGVHVLAGSIVEAVLLDYLDSQRGATGVSTADLLKKDLGQLVELCEKHKFLSRKSVDLSSVIRSYRNLIHPGRVLRLQETVDENGAMVARSLLAMVVAEIQGRIKNKNGRTATQIVKKIQDDPSFLGILPHILSTDVSAPELRRLLLHVIPQEYSLIEEQGNYQPSDLQRLSKAYRTAFAVADDSTKTEATRAAVKVIKEAHADIVSIYETAFFRAPDLKYLANDERTILKAHILHQLQTSLGLLDSCEELLTFLDDSERDKLLALLIKAVANDQPKGASVKASNFVISNYNSAVPPDQEAIRRIVSHWTTFLTKNGDARLDRFADLRIQVLNETDLIPF